MPKTTATSFLLVTLALPPHSVVGAATSSFTEMEPRGITVLDSMITGPIRLSAMASTVRTNVFVDTSATMRHGLAHSLFLEEARHFPHARQSARRLVRLSLVTTLLIRVSWLLLGKVHHSRFVNRLAHQTLMDQQARHQQAARRRRRSRNLRNRRLHQLTYATQQVLLVSLRRRVMDQAFLFARRIARAAIIPQQPCWACGERSQSITRRSSTKLMSTSTKMPLSRFTRERSPAAAASRQSVPSFGFQDVKHRSHRH